MKRRNLVTILSLAILSVLTPASPTQATAPASDPTQVHVDSGHLQGRVDGDVVRFSGVPYAAPPTGDRRWMAPRPSQPWSGVRDATETSPRCTQLFRQDLVGTEDCLYLDVVRPTSPSRPGPLPVIVWVHGGNLASGAASEYNGARLAAGGDVVVVTISYRLGALGFLSSPALDKEGSVSGNYGLLDQTEALRWVQRNTAAFGGDPGQVTLAGQSAGARSVCAHLASPVSRGLFQRAIVQSGACTNKVMTKSQADTKGHAAIETVGCATAANVPSCLRDIPAATLVRQLADRGNPFIRERRDDPWGPVARTPYLPSQPGKALRHGHAAGVPLLVGSTHDEAQGAVLGALPGLTAAEYEGMVRRVFPHEADAVLSEYPTTDYPSPAVALSRVLTDWAYSCPALSTARAQRRHAPVHGYELLEEAPEMGGVRFGAYHGWDLPFLMDTSILGSQYPELDPQQQRLSATMIGYWTAFARTGDPNGGHRPAWQPFGPSDQLLGLSADGIAHTRSGADHRCDFWGRI